MRRFYALLMLLALSGVGCGPGAADKGDGDFARGREELARAEPNLQVAMNAFAACALKNPTNFETRVELALTALRLGEPDIADRAATEAVGLMPSSAEAHLLEAHAAYLKRDYERAEAAFSRVANAVYLPAEMRSQAFSSRSVVELAAGKIDASRLSLMRAVRLNFRNAAAWYHLGVLSRDTFHFNAAAKDQFEMACRLEPDSPRERNIVRNVLPSLRDALARAAADKPGAAKRDPSRAAKLLAEGAAAERRRDIKGASRKYAEAYAADPLSWEAACSYARTLQAAEAAKKSTDKTKLSAVTVVERTLAAYRAALDAKPTSRETFMAAARFALQNRRAQVAADLLSRALAHFPDSKQVLSLYIEALGRLGTAESARRARRYQAYRRELN